MFLQPKNYHRLQSFQNTQISLNIPGVLQFRGSSEAIQINLYQKRSDVLNSFNNKKKLF